LTTARKKYESKMANFRQKKQKCSLFAVNKKQEKITNIGKREIWRICPIFGRECGKLGVYDGRIPKNSGD